MRTLDNCAGILFITTLVTCTPALAQAPERQALPATVSPLIVDDQNARTTRDQLERILRQYPPSLAEVLKLDPSLLKSSEYMEPYPGLIQYLGQHPEIAHNPSYFLGDVSGYRDDNESEALRMFREVREALFVIVTIVTVALVFTWLVRTLIDYRRWHRLSRIQTDVHMKLLDRFSTNEELLAYIDTPAGRRFLESAPIPLDLGTRGYSAPLGRIMWSAQTGLVLVFGGGGLYLAFDRYQAERFSEPFFVISILAIALGVGFIVSAGASYAFSQRLGLLDQSNSRSTRNNEAPTQP